MLANLLKALAKDVVLAPVKIVEGVAEAVDEMLDDAPKKGGAKR